jgi:uncharacterized protein YkwD
MTGTFPSSSVYVPSIVRNILYVINADARWLNSDRQCNKAAVSAFAHSERATATLEISIVVRLARALLQTIGRSKMNRPSVFRLSVITAVGLVMLSGHAAQGGFSGTWNTRTDKNWYYEMTLNTSGTSVTGTYTVTTAGEQHGTHGRISGTVSGKSLHFNWTQDHRKQGVIEPNTFSGTGDFMLSADDNSFTGTYQAKPHALLTPNLLHGTWSGTRKATTTESPTTGLTGAEQQAMLSATNAARAKHCTPALTWSAQLASAAQAWVNKCTMNGNIFAHDPQRGQTGENLAWGTSLTAQQAEQLWYSEVSKYNFAAPAYSSAVGHFTQLVWKATTQVGCAKATCGGQVLISCRYAPPGNWNVVVGPNVTAQQAQQSLMQNVPNVCR